MLKGNARSLNKLMRLHFLNYILSFIIHIVTITYLLSTVSELLAADSETNNHFISKTMYSVVFFRRHSITKQIVCVVTSSKSVSTDELASIKVISALNIN